MLQLSVELHSMQAQVYFVGLIAAAATMGGGHTTQTDDAVVDAL